jgi:flagellar hook-associated protein 3 FlgL
MKVTHAMTYRVMQKELGDVTNRLLDLRRQAATGKEVNKASDDPSAVRPILNYRSEIRGSERYRENMGTALNRLRSIDGHLDHVSKTLREVQQETIRGINGAMDDGAKEMMADMVGQFKQELLGLANSSSSGRHLFAGYKEQTTPFTESASGKVAYHGDGNDVRFEISPNERVQVGVDGREVFMGRKDTDGDGNLEVLAPNMFDTVSNIEGLLRKGPLLDAQGKDIGTALSENAYLDGDSGTGIPRLLDSSGNVVHDASGEQIELTHNGEPITLTKMRDENGNVVTTDQMDLSGYNAESGSDVNDSSQPVFVHRDGSIAAIRDNGTPILTDDSGNPVTTSSGNYVELVDGSGDPMQFLDLNQQLGELQEAMDRVRNVRGEMGNNARRLEMSMDQLDESENDLKQFLSLYEDADIVETTTELYQEENALKAAMSVTGRVADLSILKYL